MAATNQHIIDQHNADTGNVQAVQVRRNQQALQQHYHRQLMDETCCGCVDIRNGIIMLGIWLFLETAATIIFWITFYDDVYAKQEYKEMAIIALIINVVFGFAGNLLLSYP